MPQNMIQQVIRNIDIHAKLQKHQTMLKPHF